MSKDPAVSEVFFLHGKSTYLHASKVRDRVTQAVLFLPPSLVSSRDADIDDVLDDDGIKSIIATLGVGISLDELTGVKSDTFAPENLRYNKIVLVLEASQEGRNLRDQLIAYFFRFNHQILDDGHVYFVPSEHWEEMSEEEFSAKTMNPTTRQMIQVRAGSNIDKTLAILDSVG